MYTLLIRYTNYADTKSLIYIYLLCKYIKLSKKVYQFIDTLSHEKENKIKVKHKSALHHMFVT